MDEFMNTSQKELCVLFELSLMLGRVSHGQRDEQKGFSFEGKP